MIALRSLAILDVLFRMLGISLSGGSNTLNIGYGPTLAMLVLACLPVSRIDAKRMKVFSGVAVATGIVFVIAELVIYSDYRGVWFYRALEILVFASFGAIHLKSREVTAN